MDKLNLMRSFIVVAEEGSFTAAAKRLGKTKALLSMQVTQLEEALQIRLFQRSTRKLTITPSGKTYWQEAARILSDIENLESQLTQENQHIVGSIRISTPLTFGEEVLTPFIARLHAEQPQLHIDVSLTDRHIDLIEEGFDLAIRVSKLKDSNLIVRELGSSPLCLCVSPALYKKYRIEHPKELESSPCIIDSNYPSANQWQFQHEKQEIKIRPQKVITVNNARVAAKLATESVGFVILPLFAAKPFLERNQLIEILPQFTLGELPINALYPSRKHLSAKINYFIRALREYFQNYTI